MMIESEAIFCFTSAKVGEARNSRENHVNTLFLQSFITSVASASKSCLVRPNVFCNV